MKFCTLMFTLATIALVGCRATSQQETTVGVVPPGSFVKTWSAKPPFKSVKAFYHVGNYLFVYGENNQVACYDTRGGLKFKASVGETGDIVGEPIVGENEVILPTNASLEVYNYAGIRRRVIPLNRPIRSPGVLSENNVYLGLDSQNGGEIGAIEITRQYNIFRWTRLLRGGTLRHRPVLYDNVLYFANDLGAVFALTPEPRLYWPLSPTMPENIFHTDGRINAPLRVDADGVFVPSGDTKLYALDPTTGRIRWTYYAGVALNTAAQPTTDTLYQYVEGTGLVALDKKPGEPKIRQPRWINRDAYMVLADDAQHAYVIHAKGGPVIALDKKTGERRFTTGRKDIVRYVENLSPKDNTVFVITRDNTLMALTPILRAGVVGELVSAPAPMEALAQR